MNQWRNLDASHWEREYGKLVGHVVRVEEGRHLASLDGVNLGTFERPDDAMVSVDMLASRRRMQSLALAAGRHRKLFSEAVENPERDLIDAILEAGERLDALVVQAHEGGMSAQDIHRATGLHEAYLDHLLGES